MQAGDGPEWLSAIRHDNHARALTFAAGRSLTYGDLARRVAEFSRQLGQAKKLIALEGRSSEHAIVAYLSALKHGHAVALLPPGRGELLAEFCRIFDPHVVYRQVDGRWRLEHREHARPELHPDLSVLLTTSGSEGRAKWVRLSARNIDANARSIRTYLALAESDVAALCLPIHYSYGLSVLNSHLAAGASVRIICKSIVDPGWLDEVTGSGCTNFAGVPYSYALLEQIRFRQGSHGMRFMTCAGGRLAPDLVRLYADHMKETGGRFFVMYGQTEATARIAYLPPELASDSPDCIGIAIPGGALHLVDEKKQRIEDAGRVGELVYSGPNVMMGYAHARQDLRRGSEIGSLRTGDLAMRTETGLYRIAGRLTRFSKIAGIRIDHAALEDLCRKRGIEAAVTGDDARLSVFHISPQRSDMVAVLLAEATRLPVSCFDIRPLAQLPRFESGKIDYPTLKTMARQTETADKIAAGRSVLEIFQRLFHPKPVSASDTFRSLGGDSLLYVQAALAIEERSGHLPADWDRKTVAELSRTAARPGPRRIETSILLRGLAILMVVVHHATLWPLPAGAPILLMLAGHGLGRFHAASLFAGDSFGFLRSVLGKLAPYYLILLGFALAWREVPWASVFLVGNLGFGHPESRTLLPFLYWFVETYVQIMLMVALVFTIPAIRTAAARRPFEAGLVMLAVSLGLRVATPLAFDLGDRTGFNPTWLLFLLPLGWCAYFADTPKKKALLAMLAVAATGIAAIHGGNWHGSWIRYGLSAAGLVTLLFAPQIRIPRSLIWPMLTVSAASFHIYLIHRLLPEALGYETAGGGAVAILIGLATGIGAFHLHKAGKLWSRRWFGPKSVLAEARG
ncbi:MAG: AMP-binding protein [Pseudomonadota bacterium]